MTVARSLRDKFDASFAVAHESKAIAELDFLAVRIGGDAYALPLAELAGVFADRPITPAPSRSAALIGLAGVRSSIVPVFDLGVLLGYARSASPRWIVICNQIGFAFEVLEGHVRVETSAITSQASRPHTSEVARMNGQLRSIIRLSSIVSAVSRGEL